MNGQLGVAARGPGGVARSVLALDVVDGEVTAVRAVLDPAELARIPGRT